MPRMDPARAPGANARRLVMAAGLAAIPAISSAQEAPPSRIGPIWDRRQHQPSRGVVQERQRDQGVAPEPEQSREELRELNDLSRRLLPPGSPVPAPRVEGQAPAGR